MQIDTIYYIKFLLLPSLLGFIIHFLYIIIAKKLTLTDRPWKFGYTREALPYSSGISLNISILSFIGYLFYITSNLKFLFIGFAILLLLITNIIDDFGNTLEKIKLRIKIHSRLITQIVVALILIYAGISIDYISNPLSPGIIDLTQYKVSLMGFEFEYVVITFTVLWIVGIINIINFTDGIRGETLGISFISIFVLLLLTYKLLQTNSFDPLQWSNQEMTYRMLLISLGIIFSGLVFELPPAKSLIGDTGSALCGLLISVLSIMASAKIATALVVLGFPIFDKVINSVVLLKKGKTPWTHNFEHTHHKMLRNGFSESKSLIIIYLFTSLFGISALFFNKWAKIVLILIVFVLMIMLWKYLDEKEAGKIIND